MAKGKDRGFKGVPCIRCGATDVVRVGLEYMHFFCSSCDEDFSADEVREFLDAWGPVLAWVEMAPESK